MSTYEVTTSMIVHCTVAVTVDADDAAQAIDKVADIMPANYAPERARNWKAAVTIKPPKGVLLRMIRATHFEGTSGGDKAKKVAP